MVALGFASASFYASYLAALEAEKQAEKYFGVVFREKAMQSQRIKLNKRLSMQNLLAMFEGSKEQAMRYNPQFASLLLEGLSPFTERTFYFSTH